MIEKKKTANKGHVALTVGALVAFEPRHEKTCLRGFRPG